MNRDGAGAGARADGEEEGEESTGGPDRGREGRMERESVKSSSE